MPKWRLKKKEVVFATCSHVVLLKPRRLPEVTSVFSVFLHRLLPQFTSRPRSFPSTALKNLPSQEKDPAVKAMTEVTEEGKKVARMGGKKYWAVFR